MRRSYPPIGFDAPAKLPTNIQERVQWQKANRNWWEQNPMRYDWREGIAATDQSPDFFAEIDKRFFDAAQVYLPWRKLPFETLIDFQGLRDKDVLEIGVGCGSHAGLLARYARTFTGIDLTDYAVGATTQRMRLLGLEGSDRVRIIRMDAESLQFDDRSFDFIWSWGVIHHSSDTRQILKEMCRVLRPGGVAITMVYHRGFWNYYFCHGMLSGVLRGELFKTRSLHKIAQIHTDGAIARYFSENEWQRLASESFRVEEIFFCGDKSDVIPIPGRMRLKSELMRMFPDSASRFLTNRLRMGSFLVSRLKKAHAPLVR
jgi:ubiquinone/menaquinone biosynthesis C-methylase UbiE